MGQTQTVRQRKTGQTDGQGHIDRDRQTDRQTDKDCHTERQKDRQIQTITQRDRDTASQPDRQTGRK